MPEDKLTIRSVECGICDTTFRNGTVPEIAKKVAKHWNHEHGDEFFQTQPFKTEEYGGRHLHGDEYAYKVTEYYITAYDVLEGGGGSTGPFAYEYVKEIESEPHCTDCWRHIDDVDGYRELETESWEDEYLCDRCARERKIERREEENESLEEFAEVSV